MSQRYSKTHALKITVCPLIVANQREEQRQLGCDCSFLSMNNMFIDVVLHRTLKCAFSECNNHLFGVSLYSSKKFE